MTATPFLLKRLPNPLKRSLRTHKLTIKPRRHPQPSCESPEKRAVPGPGEETFRSLISGVRAPPGGLPVTHGNSMAKIYLLVAGVMLCSIPACPLGNKEIFILLRQMKTIPSQSCLEHRHDFKFPWRRENITPIEMTQVTCYHQLMLQQIFKLFTTESS